MIIKQIIFFYLALMMFSCDSKNYTRTYHLPKAKADNFTSSSVDTEAKPSGITWDKPESWIPTKGSSMRLASFTVPYSGGSGDISVIKLGGAGGGLESNVNRWRRQLSLEPKA